MFNFLSNKSYVEAAPFIRRVVDVTTPNRPVYRDLREDRRYNRTLPVMISPIRRGAVDFENAMMALSQDISDGGLALVVLEEICGNEFFVSLWPPHDEIECPIHLRCKLANCRSLAHGMWQAGFTVHDALSGFSPTAIEELDTIARKALRPQQEACLV